MRQRITGLLPLVLLAVTAVAAAPADEVMAASSGGVVVVEVEAGSAAERAGLQEGDLVLSWSPSERRDQAIGIDTMLDWWWLVVEERPRSVLTLETERRGETRIVALPPTTWGVRVRPRLEGKLLEAWQVGRHLLDSSGEGPGSERYERGAELWRVAGLLARAEGRWPIAWWMFVNLGARRADSERWEEARKAYQKALEVADENRHTLARVASWLRLGEVALARGQTAEAASAFRAAAELARPAWGRSLILAECCHLVARANEMAEGLEDARDMYRQAMSIRSQLGNHSHEHVETLVGLSRVVSRLGDGERARELENRARRISQELEAASGALLH